MPGPTHGYKDTGMTASPVLHVVHCIDTEGPMTETLEATFERLEKAFGITLPPDPATLAALQAERLDLGGREKPVARMLAPALLAYNKSWDHIGTMLDDALSPAFRRRMVDDFGHGWVYSWHCMDHVGYIDNPRHKDVGYGNVFRFYRRALARADARQDELNWHFHPMAVNGSPLAAATSFANSMGVLLDLLCRRVIEDGWFPVVNRPGFHAERPDSHAFLEQWIPFDYANQAHEDETDQPDLAGGRFGDWRRAPASWRGYHPDHDDYQQPGHCRRLIFRCLNVGTRFRALREGHVRDAFSEARETGFAVLAFADHDYRDIRPDVEQVRALLAAVRPDFPDVRLCFSGAGQAARARLAADGVASLPPLALELALDDGGRRLMVAARDGAVFGPQPFLALKTRDGRFVHDNLDVDEPGRCWSYALDEQTLPLAALAAVGVGAAGRQGGFAVAQITL